MYRFFLLVVLENVNYVFLLSPEQDQLRKLPLGLTGACLSGSLTAQEMMQVKMNNFLCCCEVCILHVQMGWTVSNERMSSCLGFSY